MEPGVFYTEAMLFCIKMFYREMSKKGKLGLRAKSTGSFKSRQITTLFIDQNSPIVPFIALQKNYSEYKK